MTGSFKSFNW